MSRFRFELATEADDEGLCEVLRQTPMRGKVSVTFRREPSYFKAAPVDGPFRQVVVCRETLSRRIVGFGLRAIRRLYVNGEPRDIGYLGSLRLLPEYRNQGLVARGYAFFRKLHEDGRTPLYLTTIAEGNEKAIEVLTSGRAGLPRYHFAGLYHTAVLALRFAWEDEEPPLPGFTSDFACAEDRPEIVEFLNREGPRRQFFPVLRENDFFTPDGMMLGLDPDSILLVRAEDQEIRGMSAIWNQQGFKQTVVHSYHGALRWLRPFIDVGAWLGLAAPLPPPGEEFGYLTVALPVVAGEVEEAKRIFRMMASGQEDIVPGTLAYPTLAIGLHERDPLWPVLRELRPRVYTTRLYHVCWDDGEELRRSLDDRVPYLELGCL